MDEDYIITWMCMKYLALKSKMNPGKSNNPSIISHFGKPVKIRWRRWVNCKYLLDCTFVFYSASPPVSPLGHKSNAVYSRETEGQITRQIDQEVVELSMQRITAVTTCDHRRNEKQRGGRVRVTGGERERRGERSKNRWGGRDEEV